MSVQHATAIILSQLLAAIHKQPCRLKRGKHLTVDDLRRLAQHTNWPTPALKTIHEHPWLALHLVALHAAGLITIHKQHLQTTPVLTYWLTRPFSEKMAYLSDAVSEDTIWSTSCQQLLVDHLFTIDRVAYLRQKLDQAIEQIPQPVDLYFSEDDQCQVTLPDATDITIRFHLLQIGEWEDATTITITPRTLANALASDYTPKAVQRLLQEAQQYDLTPGQHASLTEWMDRSHQFHIETTQLLTVSNSAKLDQLLEKPSLRHHVFERIGPRYAIVSAQLASPLQKWLADQNIPLMQPVEQQPVSHCEPDEQAYLALCVLDELNHIIPQTKVNLRPTLSIMAQQFSAEQQSEIEHRASQIMAELRRTIDGYDTQPLPPTPIAAHIEAALQQAIAEQQQLLILYLPVTQETPHYRTITPEWIETRGTRYYLHAICHQANATRTFRIDRIQYAEKNRVSDRNPIFDETILRGTSAKALAATPNLPEGDRLPDFHDAALHDQNHTQRLR
jgi:hypothetical protein